MSALEQQALHRLLLLVGLDISGCNADRVVLKFGLLKQRHRNVVCYLRYVGIILPSSHPLDWAVAVRVGTLGRLYAVEHLLELDLHHGDRVSTLCYTLLDFQPLGVVFLVRRLLVQLGQLVAQLFLSFHDRL